MFTVNPDRILGIPKGTLAPGTEADVTLLDLNSRVTIDWKTMQSKSRNTPFDGMKLRGMPVITIVSGCILHDIRKKRRKKTLSGKGSGAPGGRLKAARRSGSLDPKTPTAVAETQER